MTHPNERRVLGQFELCCEGGLFRDEQGSEGSERPMSGGIGRMRDG